MERLIYDRTRQDIIDKTPKGFYNISDINRINAYITYLNNELNLGLDIEQITLGEGLTYSKLQAIINNVNTIRESWYVAEDTPTTPIPSGWDYNKANAIEKILQHLYDFMVSIKTDKLYSGTFNSGNHIKFRGGVL